MSKNTSILSTAWRHSQIPLLMLAYAAAIKFGVQVGLALELPVWGLLVAGCVLPFVAAVIVLRRMQWI